MWVGFQSLGGFSDLWDRGLKSKYGPSKSMKSVRFEVEFHGPSPYKSFIWVDEVGMNVNFLFPAAYAAFYIEGRCGGLPFFVVGWSLVP